MKNLPAVLGEAQRRFVQELIKTGDAVEAAYNCGLPAKTMDAMARDPLVIKEIRREVLAKLHSEVLPKAYRMLADMADQAKVLPSGKKSSENGNKQSYSIPKGNIDFVKLVFDRTGIVVAREGDASRDLAEMSLDELHTLVNRLEAERAAAAKPVDAHEVQANPDQALDFMA